MNEVEEVELRVRNLSKEGFSQFRDWFHEFENHQWDQQIKADFKAGKLKALIATAREEFDQGKAREI